MSTISPIRVVNVHHFADQIIDYLKSNDHFGIDIRISDERDGLLETGGGIKKALPLFDTESPILIHNVDILSNLDISQLTDVSTPPDALLVVSRRQTKRYLLFDDEMILDGWTNIATGEVRSPYPGLDPSDLKQLAFSLQLMDVGKLDTLEQAEAFIDSNLSNSK